MPRDVKYQPFIDNFSYDSLLFLHWKYNFIYYLLAVSFFSSFCLINDIFSKAQKEGAVSLNSLIIRYFHPLYCLFIVFAGKFSVLSSFEMELQFFFSFLIQAFLNKSIR